MDPTQQIILRLSKIQNLPTLPAVLDKLRAVVAKPESDAKAVAAIIGDDPAMMARILKVVNSALYMGLEPITSLQHAVARLGLNAISNIAMSTSVFSSFPGSGQTDFDREKFWRHSISTGIGMVVLNARCKSNLAGVYTPDVLHLAGLLHDIGKILLYQYLHDDFISAIACSRRNNIPLIKAEHETFGSDHALLGAWLGLRWDLGASFLQVIGWHHEPDSSAVEYRELVTLCHCANHICNHTKMGDGGDVVAPEVHQDAWRKLGLKVEDIPSIVAEVNEKAKKSEVLMTLV